MLNDPRSHGLWEMTAPAAPETASLSGNAEADVVIVGGGFTGFSAALHLAERGRRVVLLEGAEIGYGGSGRNVGLVNAGMWVMPDELPGVLGDLYGSRLLELLGNAPRLVFDLVEKHAIDCEINPAGTLHCAVGKAGLEELTQRAEQWARRGAPVRLLDAAETAAKVGTEAYAGQIITYTVKPLLRIPLHWMTEITKVLPGELFVDEQRKGSYRLWHHEHHFRPIEGGVEMTDLVQYRVPFGWLGEFVNKLVVKRKLRQIFTYRYQRITERFGSFPGGKGPRILIT